MEFLTPLGRLLDPVPHLSVFPVLACLPASHPRPPAPHPLARAPCSTTQHSTAQQSPPAPPPWSSPTTGDSSFFTPGPTPHHLPRAAPASLQARPLPPATHPVYPTPISHTQGQQSDLPQAPQAHSYSVSSPTSDLSSPSRTRARVPGKTPQASAETLPEWPATLSAGSASPTLPRPALHPHIRAAPGPPVLLGSLSPSALTPVGGHPREQTPSSCASPTAAASPPHAHTLTHVRMHTEARVLKELPVVMVNTRTPTGVPFLAGTTLSQSSEWAAAAGLGGARAVRLGSEGDNL